MLKSGFKIPAGGHLILCILSGTIAELFLKMGADQVAHMHSEFLPWLGIEGLLSYWVWFSILFTLLSFYSWIQALCVFPLNITFALSNAVHALIPLGAWAFLHEHISPSRWAGIAFIVCGLIIIAKPFAKIETHLEERI